MSGAPSGAPLEAIYYRIDVKRKEDDSEGTATTATTLAKAEEYAAGLFASGRYIGVAIIDMPQAYVRKVIGKDWI